MQSSGFITAGEDGGWRVAADPCTFCEMWTPVSCWDFFCWLKTGTSPIKEEKKQPISAKTDLYTALIASSLAVKPVTASRAWLWPSVWFLFAENWKQSAGARLPPVCSVRFAIHWSKATAVSLLLFFFFTTELKGCRWIEATVEKVEKRRAWRAAVMKMSGGPQVSNYIS